MNTHSQLSRTSASSLPCLSGLGGSIRSAGVSPAVSRVSRETVKGRGHSRETGRDEIQIQIRGTRVHLSEFGVPPSGGVWGRGGVLGSQSPAKAGAPNFNPRASEFGAAPSGGAWGRGDVLGSQSPAKAGAPNFNPHLSEFGAPPSGGVWGRGDVQGSQSPAKAGAPNSEP